MQKAITALSMLQLAYSTDLSEERLEFYAVKLMDVNPVTLKQAVSNLIDTCKFLPTIAEIKEECIKLSQYVNAADEVPTAQIAWERVIQVAQAYGYDKGLEQLDGLTLRCANVIWSSFDPRRGNDYNESSCRSQFIKAYEQLESRERERLRLANSIKQNELLLQARKNAEQEKAMLETGNKKIPSMATCNLIELVKAPRKPVDVKKAIEDADVSEKTKTLLRGVLGG